MDQAKFMAALQAEFHEQADEVAAIIKKYIHFR